MDTHSPPDPPTVLIVDDDAVLLDLFQQGIPRRGFQVVDVNTGAGALALLKTDQQVDIVLLDMTLPDMPGLGVAETLAQTHPDLPIVIATGHDPDPATLPPNVKEVVRKPFSIRTLAARLHEIVGR